MQHNNTNKSISKQQLLGIVTLIAGVVIIGLFFFQDQTTAQIEIAPTGQPAQVFINQTRESSLPASSTASFNVSAGTTDVLVSATNAYPWRETVTAETGTTIRLQPFLIPEEPQVIPDVPAAVQQQLAQARLNPTLSASSSDQSVQLIANDNGNLIAEWTGSRDQMPSYYQCQNEDNRCGVAVYAQENRDVSQVAFYPDRSEVAIFATDNGVFAIEIDPTGETQNFQPIIENATNPSFIIRDNTIIVQSDDQVMTTQL